MHVYVATLRTTEATKVTAQQASGAVHFAARVADVFGASVATTAAVMSCQIFQSLIHGTAVIALKSLELLLVFEIVVLLEHVVVQSRFPWVLEVSADVAVEWSITICAQFRRNVPG